VARRERGGNDPRVAGDQGAMVSRARQGKDDMDATAGADRRRDRGALLRAFTDDRLERSDARLDLDQDDLAVVVEPDVAGAAPGSRDRSFDGRLPADGSARGWPRPASREPVVDQRHRTG
jgi:hypothetical protein